MCKANLVILYKVEKTKKRWIKDDQLLFLDQNVWPRNGLRWPKGKKRKFMTNIVEIVLVYTGEKRAFGRGSELPLVTVAQPRPNRRD
jgi:hypothetical protein